MMRTVEELRIINSEEYKAYIAALCRLASKYVAKIRVKFAKKAFEKYADPTVRKLVLAYGEESKKLDHDRLRDFSFVAEHGSNNSLEDFCLNRAESFSDAIWFLFDMDDKKD